jgi:hypothetical protein
MAQGAMVTFPSTFTASIGSPRIVSRGAVYVVIDLERLKIAKTA